MSGAVPGPTTPPPGPSHGVVLTVATEGPRDRARQLHAARVGQLATAAKLRGRFWNCLDRSLYLTAGFNICVVGCLGARHPFWPSRAICLSARLFLSFIEIKISFRPCVHAVHDRQPVERVSHCYPFTCGISQARFRFIHCLSFCVSLPAPTVALRPATCMA